MFSYSMPHPTMNYNHAVAINKSLPEPSSNHNWRSVMGRKESFTTTFPWNNMTRTRVNRGFRRNPGVLSTVAQTDWTALQQRRAGIIVYTEHKHTDGKVKRTFYLGVDTKSSDITDFGGGVSYKKDGNALNAAFRELEEEAHGVFGKFSEDLVNQGIVIHNKEMIIIFVKQNLVDVPMIDLTTEPVNYVPKSLQERFLEKVTSKSEIKNIIAFDQSELEQMINTGRFGEYVLYSRVRNLLQSVDNIFPSISSF